MTPRVVVDFFEVWTVVTSVITAAALMLVAYGALVLVRRRTVRERLAVVIADGAIVAESSDVGEPAPLLVLAQVGQLFARVLPGALVSTLQHATTQAGLTGRLTADVLLGVRGLVIVLGVGLACAFSNTGRGALGISGAVLVAAVCIGAVDGYLRFRAQVRRRAADHDLPTILDLLTLTLAAGLGFDNALETILIHFRGPLVDELVRYLFEIRTLGARRTDALRSVAWRLGDPPDLVDFVDAMSRAQTMGTGLLAAVESQIVILNQERHRRIASAAQRAPVRMLIPMTLFMLPVLMLIVLAPVGLRLANSLEGLH